jgi:hypothetical protein
MELSIFLDILDRERGEFLRATCQSLDNHVVDILNRHKKSPTYNFDKVDAFEILQLAPDSLELQEMFSIDATVSLA